MQLRFAIGESRSLNFKPSSFSGCHFTIIATLHKYELELKLASSVYLELYTTYSFRTHTAIKLTVLVDCGWHSVLVHVQEPPTNTALLQHPLVTSTPHLGASTVDAQIRVAVEIAKQFIAFTRQKALPGAVSTAARCCAILISISRNRFQLIRPTFVFTCVTIMVTN